MAGRSIVSSDDDAGVVVVSFSSCCCGCTSWDSVVGVAVVVVIEGTTTRVFLLDPVRRRRRRTRAFLSEDLTSDTLWACGWLSWLCQNTGAVMVPRGIFALVLSSTRRGGRADGERKCLVDNNERLLCKYQWSSVVAKGMDVGVDG